MLFPAVPVPLDPIFLNCEIMVKSQNQKQHMIRDKMDSPEDEFLHFCYPHPLRAEYTREDSPVRLACDERMKSRISYARLVALVTRSELENKHTSSR